jgi:hypothetical protein
MININREKNPKETISSLHLVVHNFLYNFNNFLSCHKLMTRILNYSFDFVSQDIYLKHILLLCKTGQMD